MARTFHGSLYDHRLRNIIILTVDFIDKIVFQLLQCVTLRGKPDWFKINSYVCLHLNADLLEAISDYFLMFSLHLSY